MLNPYVPLLHLTRGDVVESIHDGAIAVVDAAGQLIAHAGDVQLVSYLRSSAKPFQLSILREGETVKAKKKGNGKATASSAVVPRPQGPLASAMR